MQSQISSKDIKMIRLLIRDKRARDKSGLYVVEGKKIVTEYLKEKVPIERIIVSDKYNDRISYSKGTAICRVSKKQYESISSLKTGPGIMALVKKPPLKKLSSILKRKKISMILCDGIQDPANIGVLIRTAVAFKVDAVLLTKKSADIYSPKSLRASSGSHVNIICQYIDDADIDHIKGSGVKFYSGMPDKEKITPLDRIAAIPHKYILVFGSEGTGIRPLIKKYVDIFFTIPISSKLESLNVNQAAAISLYQFRKLS